LKEIIQYVNINWVEWLFVIASALFGIGYGKLAKRINEESKKNKALHDGRIIGAYNHYQDKKFCPIYAKENVKRMYDAYHDLGGNDVATGLKNKLMLMPEEPAESEA